MARGGFPTKNNERCFTKATIDTHCGEKPWNDWDQNHESNFNIERLLVIAPILMFQRNSVLSRIFSKNESIFDFFFDF